MKGNTPGSRNSSLVPFLLGGIVGALGGLLFAPKSGSETRKQIRELAMGTKDGISSAVGKGMDMYDNAKIAITSAVEAGKQAYFQEREKIQTLQ
jgi:gas vesicle protein